MSKEDILSIIVYLGMLAIAFVVGYFVLYAELGNAFNNGGINAAVVIVSIIIGLIINGIGLELAHLIGASLGGYEVVSFNIFGFCAYKTLIDKKFQWKFKFNFAFDGLTGETISVPKKDKKKITPVPQTIAPIILFLLEAVALYMVLAMIPLYSHGTTVNDMSLLVVKYGITIISTIGLMFALYNYFPAHIDSTTDGYRLMLLTKKINIEAYNEYQRVFGARLVGEEVGEIKVFDEITDYTAKLNMLTIYKRLDEGKYSEAKEMINKIISDPKKISKSSLYEYKADLLYIDFMCEELEIVKENFKKFNQEEKQSIIKGNTLATYKVYLLIEGLIDKSRNEVNDCINKTNKYYKKSNDVNKEDEYKLFNKGIEKLKASGIEIK